MMFRGVILTAFVAGCGSGGGFPDAREIDGAPPGGTFTLAWKLTDTNSQPVTCSDVGASTVTVILRNRAQEGGTTDDFSCSSAQSMSAPFEPGNYDVDFELNGLGGTLATAPRQSIVTIVSGQDTKLTPITFAIDATGGLKLAMTSNKPMGNCKPAAMMGAGITATTITLLKAAGGCAPVTFMISPGATQPGGMYTVNCGSPQIAPCIETDQNLTVAGVKSGPYVIHVRGKIGATDCWKNDDSLQVPSQGHDLVRTLNLGYQAGTPGC